jgi:ADP-ribosyl-[dinitrogen reductase] hydrolase
MIKTSESHPLRIDFVQVTGGGRIGMTFCPGKKQQQALSGPWDRNLSVDLRAISDWGAVALVSLIEDHEFDEMIVRDLGGQSENLGLEWHHLPIKDVSIPDKKFKNRWAYSGHRLRDHLLKGKDIVIHCKGGLGRTGLIAAQLLIEFGATPNTAISSVRKARKGTIETQEQAQYVRQCQAVIDSQYDQVLGCLLGGAVGDAFGYAVEFNRLSDIKMQYGEQGISEPVYNNGKLIVSDDTQMTLFTMEGLFRGLAAGGETQQVVQEIAKAYRDWLDTQQGTSPDWEPSGQLYSEPALRQNRAPGNTCLSALEKWYFGTPENPINNSKGCGGVMRVAPIGLVRSWEPERCFDVAMQSAAITHGHPSGYLSAGAMSAMIRMLIDGTDLRAAAVEALDLLKRHHDHAETSDAILLALEAAQRPMSIHTEVVKSLGEGWIGEEALAIGLYSALVGRTFPEVLAIAANHDGDSDSTASIAGQLYGAWKGLSDLPHGWIRRLDVFDPVMDLIGQGPWVSA